MAISSHVRPDADSIGSGLALCLMLEQLGKAPAFCNTDRAPYPDQQAARLRKHPHRPDLPRSPSTWPS